MKDFQTKVVQSKGWLSNNWDLEPLDLLNGLALGSYQPSHEVLIVLFRSDRELPRRDMLPGERNHVPDEKDEDDISLPQSSKDRG